MGLDLASILAKLGRADEHTQAIKSEIRRWRDSNPYLITREHNTDFTRHSLVAHVGIHPPLVRWSLMVGDVIHNLRSALDHLVYAIAVMESKGVIPLPGESNIMFPIRNSDTDFRSVEKKRLMSLRTESRTAIEACQPYNRKHSDLPPLLSVLEELEIADKHKLLQIAFTGQAQGEVGFVGNTEAGTHIEALANVGEIKEGTEVVFYTCSRPVPDMKFDRFDLLFAVMLVHKPGPSGNDRTDVPSLLALLNKEVRDVIEKISNEVLR
jgi:hypothetical protein